MLLFDVNVRNFSAIYHTTCKKLRYVAKSNFIFKKSMSDKKFILVSYLLIVLTYLNNSFTNIIFLDQGIWCYNFAWKVFDPLIIWYYENIWISFHYLYYSIIMIFVQERAMLYDGRHYFILNLGFLMVNHLVPA